MPTTSTNQTPVPNNTVFHGDCIEIMRSLPANSIEFILTDPPYLVRYHDRENRSIQNDSNTDWLKPAFAEAYRLLKQDRFMVSFYGWTQADKFFDAWRSVGFHIVGHVVFRKQYTSKARFLQYQHEQAYLLAKGNPEHGLVGKRPDLIGPVMAAGLQRYTRSGTCKTLMCAIHQLSGKSVGPVLRCVGRAGLHYRFAVGNTKAASA